MGFEAMVIPDLRDKAVLITGASTGIGAALARAFAAQGARVGLHYNASVDKAEALAAEIAAGQGRVRLIRADVATGAGARAAADAVVLDTSDLDIAEAVAQILTLVQAAMGGRDGH